MTDTTNRMPDYDVGTIVRFGEGVEPVRLGQLTTVRLHPSGTQYDGPAVIVGAFLSSTPGTAAERATVKLVALADPNFRVITRRATEVA